MTYSILYTSPQFRTFSYFLLFVLFVIVLIGKKREKALSPIQKKGWLFLSFGFIVLSCLKLLWVSSKSILYPKDWDFLGFWIIGKLAGAGKNFYDPEVIQSLELPIPFSEEFEIEFMGAGSLYPPPSSLLFYPLSFFDFQEGIVLWYLFLGVTLVGSIYLMKKILLKNHSSIYDLTFFLCLVLGFEQVSYTLHFAQTNFLLLLFVLLFIQNRERLSGGIWIALGACVKPFVLILVLWQLLNRKFVYCVVTAGSLFSLFLLSYVMFGHEVFVDYFFNSSLSRLPDWVFTQKVNQSLFAVLMRMFDSVTIASFLSTGCSFILLAITAVGVVRNPSSMWGISAFLMLGMLMTPHSLSHYAVIGLIPITMLWNTNEIWNHSAGRIPLLFFFVYLFHYYVGYMWIPHYEVLFISNFLLWSFSTYYLYQTCSRTADIQI